MKKKLKFLIILILILIIFIVIFLSYMVFKGKIKIFKSIKDTNQSKEEVIEDNNDYVFNVSDDYDETKEIDFSYKDSDDHGELVIPIDVSKCTQDIKYKIIVDVSNIYKKYVEYSAVHFEDLDIVDGCVVKEGTIKLDSTDDKKRDVIFYWRSYMRSRADYSQNTINEKISIRVITSPVE